MSESLSCARAAVSLTLTPCSCQPDTHAHLSFSRAASSLTRAVQRSAWHSRRAAVSHVTPCSGRFILPPPSLLGVPSPQGPTSCRAHLAWRAPPSPPNISVALGTPSTRRWVSRAPGAYFRPYSRCHAGRPRAAPAQAHLAPWLRSPLSGVLLRPPRTFRRHPLLSRPPMVVSQTVP